MDSAGVTIHLFGEETFVHEVEAQWGKEIPEDDAARLVEEATFVRGLLGCP